MSDREALARFLVDELGVGSPLADDEDLLASDQLDSQGILELVSYLEESFGIEVGDEDLVPENFRSVNTMTAFVARKQGG